MISKKTRCCVGCQTHTRRGSWWDGEWICKACSTERIEEEQQKYETEEWAEMNRIDNLYRVMESC